MTLTLVLTVLAVGFGLIAIGLGIGDILRSRRERRWQAQRHEALRKAAERMRKEGGRSC